MEMRTDSQPSPAAGLRRAMRLWRVVLAVWVVSATVFVPAYLVVDFAIGPTLTNLPDRDLPLGDDYLILVNTLRPVAKPLAAAIVSGWLALWVWSVLWHAGVVRWILWSGAVEVRLSEVLGHGVVWWWRYARLSLTSVSMVLLVDVVLWAPLEPAIRRAETAGTGGRAVVLLATGVVVTLVAAATCWLATLHGAWVLGQVDRRSAVLAWLRGLGQSLRRPFRSMLTLLVWTLPGLGFLGLPLLLGWWSPALRAGDAALAVNLLAGLAGAFCWVGLFLSFAPQEPEKN